MLDLIAGLRRARSAFVQIGDRVLTDTAQRVHVATRRRTIGYVPQDLALFPHLSVRRSLLFGRKGVTSGNELFAFEHVSDVLEIRPLIERGVNHPPAANASE